ncbi:hypothetical protein, partial [Escherichia coli]
PKTSIICSPMTSLKTSIKTITYLSDIGCLEIQGASLHISTMLWKSGYYRALNKIILHEYSGPSGFVQQSTGADRLSILI